MNVTLLICGTDGVVDEILGQQLHDHIQLHRGSVVFDVLSRESRAEFLDNWKSLSGSRPTFDTNVQVPCGNHVEWFRVRVTLRADLLRRVVLLIPADADIRNEIEHAVHGQAVLDTAVDAIVTIDAFGTMRSVNKSATAMFGYTEAEMLGQNVQMLMPEPHSSQHDQYLRDYIRTGEAAIIGVGRKVMARRKDGSTFPVHLAVSQFFSLGQRRFTGILRDLSELEHVQQQLLQSERLAAIGQMVTGLAHESRNALQRAQAHLDMLSLDLKDMPEQLDLAVRSKTALQDLNRLYEEVKGYAAPILLEFRPVNLPSIWRKVWDQLEAERTGSSIKLTESIACADFECEVDVHRLEQVFRNVLENAIHACGREGSIHISCHAETLNSQSAVRVDVEDDGVGMTSEIAQQLFEPFFTTKQKGTGLGLAIVERIVAAHGGTITAAAVEPSGAVISLVLPRNATRRNAVR